jgi:predicted transglutaminase-like cysteine proteinase
MMRRLALLCIGLVVGLALTAQSVGQAHARASKSMAALPALSISNFSQTGSIARPPIGWTQLCSTHPEDCESPPETLAIAHEQQVIPLTRDNWATLNRINSLVNDTIEQISDLDHYGVLEWWAYPDDGKGDCEDLQLLKRKLLMDAGMPRQTLMMTVVRDTHGEGHAVLMVRTDRGDMILDSRTSTIKPWQKTSYKFIKRQSHEDQNVWVYFGDGSDSLTTASPAR